MRRRGQTPKRLRLGATACAAAAASLGLGIFMPGTAGAVTDVEYGSWWAAQATAGALPAPPLLPPDGLWVATNPSGETAISAVRFRLVDTERDPILSLSIASHLPPGTASVRACPITSDWQPAFVGPWTARPTYDCSTSAGGLIAGTVVQFDLARFVRDGVVDVALVPVPTSRPPDVGVPVPVPALPVPGAPQVEFPSLFDITFNPLTDTAFAVATAPPPVVTTTAPPATAVVAAPAPAVPTPALPRPATAPPVVARPTTPAAGAAPVATPSAAPALTSQPIEFFAEEWRWARALAAGVLVAIAAWWFRLSLRPGADAALSALAGRFPNRDGTAPALR